MIIDTSNAPRGPGSVPGLRLSEGRYAIRRVPKNPPAVFFASDPRLGASQAAARPAYVPLSSDLGAPVARENIKTPGDPPPDPSPSPPRLSFFSTAPLRRARAERTRLPVDGPRPWLTASGSRSGARLRKAPGGAKRPKGKKGKRAAAGEGRRRKEGNARGGPAGRAEKPRGAPETRERLRKLFFDYDLRSDETTR